MSLPPRPTPGSAPHDGRRPVAAGRTDGGRRVSSIVDTAVRRTLPSEEPSA